MSTYVTHADEIGHTPTDRLIAQLATTQHGVVSLTQLLHFGLTASGVRMRVARGRLHRIHRGVYAVGHPLLKREGHFMAAVLACGDGAVLSHQAAAAHLNLRPSERASIDVTAPGRTGKTRKGIQVHGARTLTPADTTVVDAIPCSTWARTLLDLAEVIGRRGVEKACDRAERCASSTSGSSRTCSRVRTDAAARPS